MNNINITKGLNPNNAQLICNWTNTQGESFLEKWGGSALYFPLSLEQLGKLENVYSIFFDNDFIGIIQLIAIKDGNAHIGRFVLNPALTGKGLGKQALKAFIDIVFEHEQIITITLNVFDYNKNALGLYQKLGFKIQQITDDKKRKYTMIKERKMPLIFVGHGSPMNAIEENEYTQAWRDMAKALPKPKAIIAISAHWYTRGTRIMNELQPKTIYDMYGFPKALYEVAYTPKGEPELAQKAKNLIERETIFDNTWGIDHGTWSVLVKMYPEMDIPVFQISIDGTASPQEHYNIGKNLASLRDEGVLIFASGNVVHNLRLVDWAMEGQGEPFAYDFDNFIRDNILSKNHQAIINYANQGNSAKLSVPTPDHFLPLLYVLGASDETDNVAVYANKCTMGSLSMTSYMIGK